MAYIRLVNRRETWHAQFQKEAQEAERRAASVGSGGISSDDPEAVVKLRERLAELEAEQEAMKARGSAS